MPPTLRFNTSALRLDSQDFDLKLQDVSGPVSWCLTHNQSVELDSQRHQLLLFGSAQFMDALAAHLPVRHYRAV
jgi:hypothetical protein